MKKKQIFEYFIISLTDKTAHFCKLRFTPCKAEQPLQGMELQKNKHKKIEAYKECLYKEPTLNRCLLILDIKPFRL